MSSFLRSLDVAFIRMKLPPQLKLKQEQVEVLRALYDGQDTVAVLPTGYGKSLIYQMLPFLISEKLGNSDTMIVIVVTPITAIMEQQVNMLRSKGIMACYLSYSGSGGTTYEADDSDENDTEDLVDELILPKDVTVKDLLNGAYNILYTHPESLFNSKSVAKMLRSEVYKERLCGIVIDEAHIIQQWGPQFRPKFGCLGEMISLYPDIAHLALTATAKQETVAALSRTLMFKDYKMVAVNPDRPNIFIEVAVRPPNVKKVEKYISFIEPLAEQLKNELETFPVSIVYVESLEALGFCYQYLSNKLKDIQYNGKSHVPENRLFAQFHTDYTVDMKRLIISELSKDNPAIRLVLATVALGMGLNSSSIVRVMHMRPPVSLEHYLQEIGRAGRLGQPASSLMFYNNSVIASNRKGLTTDMVNFCKNKDSCLRLHLVKYFGFEHVMFTGSKIDCCINCRLQFQTSLIDKTML